MAMIADRLPGQMSFTSTVPVFRPDITEDEIDAVAATMRSGWIGPGPRVAEFELRFALAFDVPHAIAAASGTAALQAALAVLEVGPGDEVIIPSFTWVSVFQVVTGLGATPVFADVDPDYLTIDPEDVAGLITRRTKGIVAVHHGGQLADMDALAGIAREHGLWLVDDAAHACGAAWRGRPVGGLCTMTTFSFNAMKNLSIGDGGMVTTSDPALAHGVSLYRSLGIDRDTYCRYGDHEAQRASRWCYDVVSAGQRIHMNDIAASVGLVQLRRLAQLNARRGHLVTRYDERLRELTGFRPVRPRPGTEPSHHMYTVRMADRDAFIEQMGHRGISIGVHYIPIHLFKVAQPFRRELPVTEEIWRQVTTFPLYPAMTDEEHARVVSAARESARSSSGAC
jgi:perosamine synthetase